MADLHICGTCRMQFNSIELFITHKKQCVNNPVIVADSEMASEPEEHPLMDQDSAVLENCETSIDPIMDISKEEQSPLATEAPDIGEVNGNFAADEQNIDQPVEQVQAQEVPENSMAVEYPQYLPADEILAQQNQSFASPQVAGQASAPLADAATCQTSNQSQIVTAAPAAIAGAQPNSDSQNWSAPIVQKVLVIVPATSSVVQGQTPTTSLASTTTPTTAPTATSSTGTLKSKSEPRKKYTCRFKECNYSTVHSKDLERHYLTHTGQKPHQCLDCGRSFSRMDKLKIHMRTHSGMKPYKCNLCSYATVDNSSLRAHQRVHNDERPYKCQICQYASRNSSQLTVHLRTHTGDAPFQCYICDAKFKVKSDVKRHIRCHTGEKPYHCPHCPYKCTIKGNLTKHIDINHSERNSMKCPECDFVTSSRRMLRDHTKKHITGAAFKCVICNHVATSKTALKVHLGVHTDDKPHKCSFCHFSTRQSGNIRLHVQRRHPEKFRSWCDKADVKGKAKKRGKGTSHSATSLLVEALTKIGETTSPKKSDRLKATCQKPFVCKICGDSFVREDSLRCHTKHHQTMKEAEIREGAALAVLQLKNPITNTGMTIPASSIQVTTNSDGSGTAAGNQTASVVRASQAAAEVSQATTSTQPASAPPSGHRHGKARARASGHMTQVNQSANMMAIMQNNENRAVEDNMQNMAISMRRQQRSANAQTTTSTTTQAHVPMTRPSQTPQSMRTNHLPAQTYASQAISTSQIQSQTVQSIIPSQVIAGPQVQHQQVAIPTVGSRPVFVVSSSGLVRVIAPHQVQQTPQFMGGQRNVQDVQMLISDNRTVQIIGQPNHIIQNTSGEMSGRHVTGQLVTRQVQAMPQIQTPQGTGNIVSTLQGQQVIQEIPVVSQQLATSQPNNAVLVSQPSSVLVANPQNQIVSQNQAPDSQSHLVTAIINQHLHLVDQRQIISQGQGQTIIQAPQGDLSHQQGQVISQGQIIVPQGQAVMAVQNVGQGLPEGQQVVQGQVVQGHSVQSNQGNILSTEGQQAVAQANQSHVIIQVVTGETNADGTPQMKTIQVPVGVVQGLLASNRKDKEDGAKLPQRQQIQVTLSQQNKN